MTTMHGPLKVTRDENGRANPPYDSDASDLDRLRWLAGDLEAKHGIRIRIQTGGYWSNGIPVPDSYGFQLGARSTGPIVGFYQAWTALTYFGLGIEEATGVRACCR